MSDLECPKANELLVQRVSNSGAVAGSAVIGNFQIVVKQTLTQFPRLVNRMDQRMLFYKLY